MSWLGNGFREEAKALSDAYASMYKAAEEADEVVEEVKEEEPQQLDEKAYGGSFTDKTQKPAAKPMPAVTDKKPARQPRACPGHLQKTASGGCAESVEQDILAALQDAYEMMYEKKKDSDKCGEGTYWDKEEKKCKKKKSSKTTVIVGRGGYYGGHGHSGGSDGDGDGDGGDTDGGDGGGDGGGGGGGE